MSTHYGQESAEDALEETRDNNLTERDLITPLLEDHDPPVTPSKNLDKDRPSLDDINDRGEVYEEGVMYKPYAQSRPPGRRI